jgi:hypothetical protein
MFMLHCIQKLVTNHMVILAPKHQNVDANSIVVIWLHHSTLQFPLKKTYGIPIDQKNEEDDANDYIKQIPGSYSQAGPGSSEFETNAEADRHRKRRYAYFHPLAVT